MSRNRDKGDYSRLKRKVFLRILLIICAAVATVAFLRFLAWGRLGNVIVYFLGWTLHLSSDKAQMIYQLAIRNHIYTIYLVAISVFALILFRFLLTWFARYFNEISVGMEQLMEQSHAEITLSPELASMEAKLNKIKSTLAQQKRDAQDAEQRKNNLVIYLAHDIKTPLTSVIGYLSLLNEAPDMPAEQKAKYVGITLEKAYRLEQLIDEFFEITRFNLQSIVLNKDQINLTFMLQQLADEFYPMLAPAGKQAVVHAPNNLSLWGDADKLSRVFNNILKNAVAYSYQDSTIDISAAQQGDNVFITFSNHGDPIPPEKLDAIFDQFFRLDASRSSHSGGAGLGLAIAQKIVAAHEGTITVQSDKELTVFTVKLPNQPGKS